jgi:hypothetical protein
MSRKITRSQTAERAADGFVVLSTDTPCPQDGLILAPAGWDLSRTSKVPLKMFYNHATSYGDEFPIGRWEDVQVKDGKLVGKPVFAAEEHPERAGVVAKLWDGGFLDDVSVSFRVNGKSLTGPVQVDGRDYMVSTSHELIECSIVGIGADQNAGKGRLEQAVSRGIITDAEAASITDAPESATEQITTEVERLREELETLRQENDRLRADHEQAAPPAAPEVVTAAEQRNAEPEKTRAQEIAEEFEREFKRQLGRLPD